MTLQRAGGAAPETERSGTDWGRRRAEARSFMTAEHLGILSFSFFLVQIPTFSAKIGTYKTTVANFCNLFQ